jgi:K+-transporting ATPase c subunit
MQKSPKGAARLSVQKSPKGAAGIAQQVCKIEVFSKRLSVQKSPKGAAGIIGAQNRSLFQKTLRAKVAYGRSQNNTISTRRSKSFPKDSVHKSPTGAAGSTKVRNLIIQITVTYTQRGHHILHWLNLQDDTHLPVVE